MVISGDTPWTTERVHELMAQAPGDWLWVTESTAQNVPENKLAPSAVKTLLGREFLHAVFDARDGLDAQALAILSGTLKAGSLLVLLTPFFEDWPQRPDADSVRWSDTAQPIPTPNFIRHLLTCLQRDAETVVWRQDVPILSTLRVNRPLWQPGSGTAHSGQQKILRQLLAMDNGVAAVIAARGRGKSALAGMLIRQADAAAIVTAPAKAASDVLAEFAGERFNFFAPDRLLEMIELGHKPAAEWLIVDEAAAIPAPLLKRLITAFPKVLLTTTVQGYEGTGRGFALKLCAGFPDLKQFALDVPQRWARGCPLERIIDTLLAFDDAEPAKEDAEHQPPHRLLLRDAHLLLPFYRLLCSAHYRTSPNDLRRLLDAPGQHLWLAGDTNAPCGALWATEEGGLSHELSRAVWAGSRRPRGNLVAQSLAAHGGSPLAATLRGVRITRVAVSPDRQRQGLGSELVAAIAAQLNDVDYLAVSFGFTDELWRFWQRAGFRLVRIGTHREASSGCYNAMALLPLTAQGEALTERESTRLARTLPWLLPWTDLTLETDKSLATGLDEEDWLELAGFAWALRPLEACLGSLGRLLATSSLPIAALRGELEQRLARSDLSQRLGLTGRKALLTLQRSECAEALIGLDQTQAAQLQSQVSQWKNFD